MARKNEALISFRADVSEFTDGIKAVNKSLSNLKSDLKVTNSELKANGDSFETLTKKANTLKEAMSDNAKKIELLEKSLETCKKSLGENSDEYSRLYKQLNNAKTVQNGFQSELKTTERALDDLGNELKDTTREADNFNDEMKKSGSFMDDFSEASGMADLSTVSLGTAMGNLASDGISFCIEKLSEFCEYLWDLPEATEEFRQSMARVETVAKSNGKSMETLNKMYKELWAYYEDDNATGNVVANLAQLDASEITLMETTKALQGAWAEFGDGINNETLAEDINLTVKLGKAQGGLLEVLERVGVNIDDFNKGLASCKTEEEKLQYVNKTLNSSLGDSRKAYENAYKAQLDYNRGLADVKEKEAELAEAIIPIQEEWLELKGILLNEVTPAVKGVASETSKGLNSTSNFIEDVKELYNTNKASFDLLGKSTKIILDIFNPLEQMKQKYKQNKDAIDLMVKSNETLGKGILDVAGFVSDFTGKLKEGKNVTDALDYAMKNYGKRSKEEMIACGDITEQMYNKMQRDANGAFGNMEASASSCGENMKSSVQDFTKNGKDNLDALGKHKYGLSIPNVSPAEKALNDSVEKNKRKTNELSTHKYNLSSPSTADASKSVDSGLTNFKNKLTNWKPIWKISNPNTTDASKSVDSGLTNFKNKLTNWKPIWKISNPSTIGASNAVTSSSGLLGTLRNSLGNWSASWKISNPNTSTAVQHVKNSYAKQTFNTNVKGSITKTENKCGTPIVNSKAKLTSSSNSLSTPIINSKARLTSSSNSLSTPIVNSKARLTSSSVNCGTPSINSKGKITSTTNGLKKTPTISIKGIISSVGSSIKGLFNWRGGVAEKGFVNWHASGAIVKKPTLFNTPYGIQGVGDRYNGKQSNPEAILPLDSFYNHLDSKIEQVNNTAILSRIYSLLATMELRLDVDGKEFTRTVVAPNSKEINNYNNMRII